MFKEKCFNMGIVSLVLSGLLSPAAFAEDSQTTSAAARQEQEMSLNIIGPVQMPADSVSRVNTHLNPMNAPVTETQPWFGETPKDWNDQSRTILPFLLASRVEWTVKEAKNLRNKKVSSISKAVLTKKERKRADKTNPVKDKNEKEANCIKVLNGYNPLILKGKVLPYKVMGVVTVYGKRNQTTIDCFSRAVEDTAKFTGNVLVILKASSTPGMVSSTIGLGGSATGGKMSGSQEAYSGGSCIGYARNSGGPTSKAYLHGVAVRVSPDVYNYFHPDYRILLNGRHVAPELPDSIKGHQTAGN